MYGQKNLADYLYFLSDWYRNGKNKPEEFYNKYPFDPEDKRMLSELQKHKSWIEETQIRATPTILFNGYELPDRYKVEDLKHFSHIEIVQNAV